MTKVIEVTLSTTYFHIENKKRVPFYKKMKKRFKIGVFYCVFSCSSILRLYLSQYGNRQKREYFYQLFYKFNFLLSTFRRFPFNNRCTSYIILYSWTMSCITWTGLFKRFLVGYRLGKEFLALQGPFNNILGICLRIIFVD